MLAFLRSRSNPRVRRAAAGSIACVLALSAMAVSAGAAPAPAPGTPSVVQLLAKPFSPATNDPAVVAKLGSPATPTNDLRDGGSRPPDRHRHPGGQLPAR